MQKTLHDHHTSISTGGRLICKVRFADDIDLMGGSNDELQDLANRLVDRSTAYGMEVSTEKSKIMTSSTNNISADIIMNGLKLGEVTGFKYLGAILCKDGTCLAGPHQDCLSSGSNGKTKQDLAAQHHQLCKQVQDLQVSCHLHPAVGL